MRQGATNCANKTFTRSSERHYAAAQTWWQQARADFLLGNQLVDRVEPFGKAGDVDGFGLCTIAPKSLLATLASVLERRRPWRRAQLCSIGRDGDGTNWCSLDFAKRQGEMVGGASWYATLTNGKGDLNGPIVTDSVKVDDVLIAWLTTIGKRPNFKANALVVDNTPPAVDQNAWCVALKEALDVEYILQRQNFNNMHKAYHLLITVGWREAWSYLDRELEQENDARLAMGAVKKDISFRGDRIRIVCGTPTSSALIAEWKASSAYHELFTASSVCVAPRRVYSAEVLDVRVADTSSDARALAPDASNVARLAANALLRVKNCVVPAGACEFRFTGQCDFNGDRGTVAVFHTCHNENWNGIHLDIITGNNLGEGVAGGSYNEGITNRNFRRAIERGEAENVSHNKPWLVERANFFAGHGGGGDGFLSIVSQKPYINKRPPDAGPREICVSAVACDERLKMGSIYATDDAEEKKIVPESSAQLRPDLFRRDLWWHGDTTLLPPRGDAAPQAFSTPSLFGGAAAVATPLRLAAPALGASASVLSAPAVTSGFSGTPAAVAFGGFGAAPAPHAGAAFGRRRALGLGRTAAARRRAAREQRRGPRGR
ncbi:hypothetical protein M885DRAFT_532790, partial [Pelagophyceae sp. CCMP2097]